MRVIGIDIGTTTMCALVLDTDTGKVLEDKTILNDTTIKSSKQFESLQDAELIAQKASLLVEELFVKWKPIGRIGVTGQMHGIVYVGEEGAAVSPLYTWQDGRGNEKSKTGESYVEEFGRLSGYQGASGYGLVTHYYNMKNALIPNGAVKICTIPDYIAMKLARSTQPIMHITNAASLAGYHQTHRDFDKEKLAKLGMDCDLLPEVTTKSKVIGKTREGIPVVVGIGDSQASYLGSVQDQKHTLLINIGTGSQASLYSSQPSEIKGWESRPFTNQGYILTASSLCGGRAYGALENFFGQVSKMLGLERNTDCYQAMEDLGLKHEIPNPLEISTLFCGSRMEPLQRGSIQNLGLDNFTPQHLIHGVLDGMINELFDLYVSIQKQYKGEIKTLVGSGNAIRRNPILRQKIEKTFGMSMHIPNYAEEAAFGAALFAYL